MDNGRIALVTGASRGLGAAIASRLGKDGFRVAVNCFQSPDRAKKLVADIQASGGTARAIQADITDSTAIGRLLADINQAWDGTVDVLVNNATGPQPERPLEEYSWQDFEDQINFFIKSPVLLVQALLPAMKKARHGRIINIVSEVADNCRPDFSPYIAAKCAQLGLTRSWALEFAPWNITVNAVSPGWVPTDRHAGVDRKVLAAYQAEVPLKRQGTPEEVASAVSFFAAAENGFVSGQRVSVNGAHTF
ncbi:MAG: SDR family oxidoreductase [Planctomycetota bacterium]|jgi:3-oxoacyl-[acyl-carrier protein] reductase|nr:SDR family oxidoreductase [Planctomycetota bacterium]